MALPDGVAVDSAGNLYIADTVNHRIRKVTVDGTIQTIAGSSNYGTSGDGGPASQALLINPRALVFDAGGNLLLTDSSAHMVRRITPAGIIQRVSGTGVGGHTGDGGPAIAAEDWTPWGLAADSAGNIYIGDTGSYTVRMVSPSGIIQTLLSDVYATGLLVDGSGNLWIAGNPALAVFTETSSPIPLAPAIAGNYFASNGIANSADPIFGQAGVVAAGEMVTVTGSYLGPVAVVSAPAGAGALPTELGGVQVLFGGVAAPLLAVSANQIQAVVPFAVAGQSTVEVTVQYGGLTSNPTVVGVLPAVPGIFEDGDVYVIGQASPGSIFGIVVTGAGVMNPPQTDGQIGGASAVPVLPVSAWLGVLPFTQTPAAWIPLEVTYAGSADWLVAGTIQVNVKLPNPLPATDYTYPIAVQIGNSGSAYVTLLPYIP